MAKHKQVFPYFQSGRCPFKVMTASTPSSTPIATAKEKAPLLWPGLPNHAFAALHSTVTERVILENRNMHFSQFVGLL